MAEENEEIKEEESEKEISKHDFYFESPLYELLDYSDLKDSLKCMKKNTFYA